MIEITGERITVVIVGPQGCGKTILAQRLHEEFPSLEILETNVYEIKREKRRAPYARNPHLAAISLTAEFLE